MKLSGYSTGGSADTDPKTVDYSKVDVTFGPNDGEAVNEFTGKFYDGSCDGKVVKITGLSENWGSGSCTIYSNVDESERWGISWVYADGEALPENDVNLEITGVFMQADEWGSRNLVALPENVKVVKSDGTPWATELNYSGNIDLEIGLEDKEALNELIEAMSHYECEYDGKTVKIDSIQPAYFEGNIGIVDADGSITSVAW